MKSNKPISILVLTIIVASLSTVAPFSIDTYLPSFPHIAYELKATAVQMQQSMSFYMAGFAIMTLFSGSISDALGRKNVIIVALLAYSITSLVCVFITTIETFLWLRFIQGVTASVGAVIGRAIVRDLFHGAQAQKVMSHVLFFFAAAPAFAPIIGGFLEVHYGWRSVFVFLMLLALVIVVVVFLKLQETLKPEDRHSMHPIKLTKSYIHALTHKRFNLIAMILTFNFGGFFIYITASPRIIFTHLGLASDDFYLMFVPIVAGIMLGSYLSGRLSGKITPIRMLSMGSIVMLIAAGTNVSLALTLPVQAISVIAPVVLYAIGLAFTLPVLTVMGIDQLPQHRGLASSLQSFLQMSMNALIAGVITPLIFNATQHLAYTMMLFNLVGLVFFVLLYLDLRRNNKFDVFGASCGN